MIEKIPVYISIIFGLTTVATLLLFFRTMKRSVTEATRNKALVIIGVVSLWLVIQCIIAIKNVYSTNAGSFPPKILLLGILPPMLAIVFAFATTKGRRFIDSLPLKDITYTNAVRVPVELVLYSLYIFKAVPQILTFEGRNFDILSGITAPFIAYFGFTKQKLSKPIILGWNFVCLALLANIVANALLSAPLAFQQFGFDQPNIAILHFPISWLPTFVVPVVLFGHLVSIRQLIKPLTVQPK